MGRLPTPKAFRKAHTMFTVSFLPPSRFVRLKYLARGTMNCLIYKRSPGPLVWDSALFTLEKVLLPMQIPGAYNPEMGGAQGTLSRGDLITQPFSRQSRAISSQLCY